MQKKSNRMIMFAVIAVIIVAVPITFLSSLPSYPKTTDYTSYPNPVIFKHNLTNLSLLGMYHYITFGTSYSLINQSSYASSSLTFTAGVTACEAHPSSPFNPLFIATKWKISGNFAPDLHPSSFTVTVSFYLNNQSLKDIQFPFPCCDQDSGIHWSNNATLAKIPSQKLSSQFAFVYSLQNNTQTKSRYLFGTNNNQSDGRCEYYYQTFISPKIFSPDTLTMNITLSIDVAGKQIIDPVVFYLINTGAE